MDRYRLIEQLGTGGMSVVWRGFDEVLGRSVAVKVLAPKLVDDPRSRQRIQAEARAAALLSHPHVAAVFDFGHTPAGEPFVVMELIPGRCLEDAGPLPVPETLRLGAQLASALTAVHARGLVHRDVKPANVMLTADGAKLVDFGISAIAGDTSDIDDELLGTPAYLAPERLRGLPTTAAADIYALGLLLYKTLTGRLPWPAETTDEMLRAHRQLRPAPLPSDLALPKPIADGILRCLAKAPENRPSADDMRRLLAGSFAAVPPVPLPRPHRRLPRFVADGARLRGAVAGARAGLVKGIARARMRPRHLATRPGPAGPRGRRATRSGVAAGVLLLSLGMLTMFAAREPGAAAAEPAWVAAGAAPTPDAPGCVVQYTVRTALDGTFAADLVLTNTGRSPVPAWSLAFRLPEGQSLGSAGAATWKQDGTQVRLDGAAAIAPGAAATVALTGSYQDPPNLPSGFALNNNPCQQVLIVAAPPAAASSPASSPGNATTTRPAAAPPAGNPGPGNPPTANPPGADPPAVQPPAPAHTKRPKPGHK